MESSLQPIPFSELVEINPSTPNMYLESDALVSFIPMQDVSEAGQWITHQVRRLQEINSGYTSFREGDVLFAKITPCMENGKGCHARGLMNGIGFGTTEFHVLRAKSIGESRFIFHWTQSETLRLKAAAMMTGSAGQRRVPTEFFDRYRIPYIPKPEQQKIAEVLDTVDKLLALTDRHIAKLKQAKAGLLHDLLTHGIDEHGELRDPVAFPEQFKETRTAIGRIPKDWDVMQLSSVCERVTDGAHQSVTTSESGVPFLYVSCVRDGRILWNQTARVSESLYQQLSRGREVKPGLILYTVVGSYGHAALVRDDQKFSFQRHIAYILPDPKKIIPGYLCMWLNSSQCRIHADRVALGNAQKTVTLGALNLFPVLLPDTLEEQTRILEYLDTYDRRITNKELRFEKLNLLKKGLMADLLTGRIRVKLDITKEG